MIATNQRLKIKGGLTSPPHSQGGDYVNSKEKLLEKSNKHANKTVSKAIDMIYNGIKMINDLGFYEVDELHVLEETTYKLTQELRSQYGVVIKERKSDDI